jgi:hypothetical protein
MKLIRTIPVVHILSRSIPMLLYAWMGIRVMRNDSGNKLNHASGNPKQTDSTEVSLALRYTCPTCLKHIKIKNKFILTLMSYHILHIWLCMRTLSIVVPQVMILVKYRLKLDCIIYASTIS